MDFAKAQSAGAKFCIVRCGGGYMNNGVPFVDDRWLDNLAKLQTLSSLPWSAYWYFIPINVKLQADRLIELVKDSGYWFPIGIDCEKWWTATAVEAEKAKELGCYERQVAISPQAISPSQASDALEEMISRLNDADITLWLSYNGLELYTRGSFWNVYYQARPAFSALDLWVARYSNTLEGPWSDGLYQPNGWEDWRFWQWSADGNLRGEEFGASSNSIDIDYFNGDEQAFNAWIGVETGVYPFPVRVTQQLGTVVRAEPKAGEYMGTERYLKGLTVFGAEMDDDDALWYLVNEQGDEWVRAGHVGRVE